MADTVEQWVGGWHSGAVGQWLTQGSSGSVAGTVELWVGG